VLFERICRKNGVTQRLTRPRSPTTTGKVEGWHQTLQAEFLEDTGPFASIADAQAAVDKWREAEFSDRFKINILNELLFYVANTFVTKRCGWSSGRRGYEAGAVCAA
jgi:Integrase core domain